MLSLYKSRKSEFLNKRDIVCDLERPLSSYLILWKIWVFTMLAFIEFFKKICAQTILLERKKLKSCNPGVTESQSFLVRYRRTYVLNNNNLDFCSYGQLLALFSSNPAAKKLKCTLISCSALHSYNWITLWHLDAINYIYAVPS